MNIAIILAGGSGSRLGLDIPKQFVKINGEEIIIRTIKKFEINENIHNILIIMNTAWITYTKKLISRKGFRKIIDIIPGGKTRQESSYKALSNLVSKVKPDDIIIIHDAVRPFISNDIITRTISETQKHHACCVAVKSIDTVVKAANNVIWEIPNRNTIYNEQTPQGFRFSLIWKAIQVAKEKDFFNVTDDVSFVHNIGEPVYLLEGDYNNIKITTKIDLYLAEKISYEIDV